MTLANISILLLHEEHAYNIPILIHWPIEIKK